MRSQRTSRAIRDGFAEASRHMPKRSIFLVDNDPDAIYILALMLRLNEFEVAPFTDPGQALASFSKDQFDLLLLEVQLPGTSGFELYRKIKQIDENVRVCFMTSYPAEYMQEFTKSFPELDCKNLVEKPAGTAQILKIAESYFER